jgi:predicted adenylyl cyclase CyaB
MPVNLEIKACLGDSKIALQKAGKLNVQSAEVQNQKDTYYKIRVGRLKLREIPGRESELIYYNRQESDDIRTSDYTVCKFPPEKSPGLILAQALGIIAVITKHRHIFIYRGARIYIDDVEGLGWFIEFEVPFGTDRSQAEQIVNNLSKMFNIQKKDILRASYVDLLMIKEGNRWQSQ